MINRIKSIIWFKIKRKLSVRRRKDLEKALSNSTDLQLKIINITNGLLSNSESKLVFSNISFNFLIEYNEVICKIDDGRIILTDGNYSYDIPVDPNIIQDIRDRFLSKIESRKKSIEKKVIEKMYSSLENVGSSLLLRDNSKDDSININNMIIIKDSITDNLPKIKDPIVIDKNNNITKRIKHR